MMTIPQMRLTPWLKDTLPNMLWVCSLIATNDERRGMLLASRTLDTIDDVLAEMCPADELEKRPPIDGQLTTLNLVPETARGAILAKLQSVGLYSLAVPEEFAHALGMYPAAPGRWLIEPWINEGLTIDRETAQRFLNNVLLESIHGQARVPTRAKAVVYARWCKAGRVRFAFEGADEIIELLVRYPDNLTKDELDHADAFIRASFLGLSKTFEQDAAPSPGKLWAQEFWRSNWHLYPCVNDDAVPGVPSSRDEIANARALYVEDVQKLHEAFLATARQSDPDLFEPDRYEVLTGITLRALRLIHAGASTPILWSGEHGAPLLRSLIEALIVLRWLIKREDPELYTSFKEYGRGHLKLLKLHLEEYADSLDEPDEDLQDYLKYLDSEVNQDVGEEWQNISIQSNFAGMNTREMAIEVGMEREYRLVFAPASSAAHGEWYSIDRYVLQRCRNLLHGGHRMPRATLTMPIGPQLIESSLSLAEDLVAAYTSAMRSGNIGEVLRGRGGD
jgi:hypothetical protein